MKIAVTYDNGNIFQHFGKTEFFKVYEIEDNKVISSEVIGSNGTGHGASVFQGGFLHPGICCRGFFRLGRFGIHRKAGRKKFRQCCDPGTDCCKKNGNVNARRICGETNH